MNYNKYQDFCVSRSQTDLDEISFRLLRAASRFVAEIQEYLSENDPDRILDELGDVLFWTVTLDYWLSNLGVPHQDVVLSPFEPLEGAIFILDCVEKYSRNKDIQKLVPARVMITVLLEQFSAEKAENELSFNSVSKRNYNKLTSVKPRVNSKGE